MADELTEIQPGDLITADLLNAIIRRLQGAGGGTGGGTVDVPNLFGRTLASARELVTTPGSNLQLGVILDPAGNPVSGTDPAAQNRRVLSQQPVWGIKVTPGTAVNLVISASSTGPAPGGPTMNPFPNPTVRAGEALSILGTNFSPIPTTVRVGTIDAPVNAASTTNQLLIVVPSGAELLTQPVAVAVTIGGVQVSRPITVQAPAGPPIPTVGTINGSTSNAAAMSGTAITLGGSDFGTVASAVRVFFGPPDTSPSAEPAAGSFSSTSLVVTIPKPFAGLSRNNPTATVRPVVRVAGRSSLPSPVALTIAQLD